MFDLLVVRSIVSWNAMINGYVDVVDYLEALKFFLSMLMDGVHFDSVTTYVGLYPSLCETWISRIGYANPPNGY